MDFIKDLRIKNFKSIKDLHLDCRRINVFIGKPNVGKSNILEALGLIPLSQMFLNNQSIETENKRLINSRESKERGKFELIDIKSFFRVDKVRDLFYKGERANPIQLSIRCGDGGTDFTIDFVGNGNRGWKQELKEQNFYRWKDRDYETDFNDDFILLEQSIAHYSVSLAPFKYKEDIQFHDVESYDSQLMPPYGNNLPKVIKPNPELMEFISGEMSKSSDIEFAIDEKTNTLTQYIRIDKGLIYSLPYKSLADTLKRFIFYMAAIKSGYKVITLEEPEAHSFPPYVSRLADEIIETKETQFFIATHSTVLLTNLIENTPKKDLRVFVCDYDDKQQQTIATPLSEGQLSESLVYGLDMFFNINHFLDDPIDYSA